MPQSLSQVYLHLIFSTKRRERTIQPQHLPQMFSHIGMLLTQLGCQPLIVGGIANHIHALFCLNRTQSMSNVVCEIKRKSSCWYEGVLRRKFEWQAGYGIFSVSQSVLEATRQYIANQEAHHQRKSFEDEFRDILNKYQVPYDEHYLWD